jgi:hypothetical protein
MKKLVSLLLLCTGLFLFTGCGDEKKPDKPKPDPAKPATP